MAREYTIPFEKITMGLTVSDLAGYIAAANKYAEITRFWVDECDATLVATPFDLDLALAFFTATVTPGTGIVSQTPLKTDNGDPAASGSGFIGPTSTNATTSGARQLIWPKACHIYQGCDIVLPKPIPVINLEAVFLQLMTAPSLACKLSGGIYIREVGG